MAHSIWYFVLVIHGLLILPAICQDPCNNTVDISDERRSVNYISYDGNFLCDQGRIVEGKWYTFKTHTGGKMPEESPDFFRCGTQAPIWFFGTHPTDGEVHNATACVNLGRGCDLNYTIQVKLCPDGEYVYKLAEPEGCDLAYCAGSGIPCEQGKVYVESEQGCTGRYPVMSGPPKLDGPFEPADPYKDTFWFECSVRYDGNRDSATFEVTWLFDNIVDPNIPVEVVTDSGSAKLDELELIGHMDKTVSCAVRSLWPDHPDTPSPSLTSENGYWVGIKPIHPIIEVRGEEIQTDVVFESTVPITCGCCKLSDRANCQYEVTLQSLDGGVTFSRATGCTAKFTPQNKTAVIPLSAANSAVEQNEIVQIMFQNVAYENEATYTSIWKDYQVTPVKVHLIKNDTMGYCDSVTDPHIRTFDRTAANIGRYHVFTPGKFILVKSTSPRVFEIHSVLRSCARNINVACNCGVAVREGNIVLGVDNCKGQFRTFKDILVEGTSNDGTITNDAAGTTFTIVMPSGAKVIAKEDKNWHLNVYVYLPTEFKNNVSGLCGTWDDNYKNDFQKQFSDDIVSHTESIPKEFSESYRIPKGESFFEKIPCDRLLEKDSYLFCKCSPRDKIACEGLFLKNYSKKLDIVFRPECGNTTRMKRQADSFADFFGDLAEEEDFIETDDPTWPTPSGITEEQATAKCDAVLKESAVFDICANDVKIDVEETKSTCVIDVQLADDLTVAYSLKDVFESSCVEEAKLNVAIGNNGTDEASSDLAATIASKVCINQCSGHGECENGSCICDSGYLGADCSVDKNKAPQVMKVEFDGICDTHLDTCQGIKVTADVIISGTLCRFTAVEEAHDGFTPIVGIAPEFTTSEIISRTKVFCGLPNVNVYGTYHLSLSFNGQSFSNETIVSVYNSVCVECYQGGQCIIKSDTCIIGAKCYTGSICSACDNAVDIGDPKRSTAHQADDEPLCDASRIENDEWYRFNQYTGNMMPDECIEKNKCGTVNPIWLNGTHPTAGTLVSNGMACANYNGSCCDWSVPVRVRYCTDNDNAPFYAYELTPPPDCDAAYCSGDKMPCMDGHSWDSETDVCLPPGITTIYIEVNENSKNLVLTNAGDFETAISESINKFCVENTDECCLGMDLDYSESGSKTSAANYPVISVTTIISEETEGSISVEAMVAVGKDNALLFCGSQDIKDGSLTLSSEVITEAITAGMADIEAKTGIDILESGEQMENTTTMLHDVPDTTTMSHDDPDTTTILQEDPDTTTMWNDVTDTNTSYEVQPEKSTKLNLTLVITLSIIGVAVILAAITGIVIYAEYNKNKPGRTQSKASVASGRLL